MWRAAGPSHASFTTFINFVCLQHSKPFTVEFWWPNISFMSYVLCLMSYVWIIILTRLAKEFFFSKIFQCLLAPSWRLRYVVYNRFLDISVATPNNWRTPLWSVYIAYSQVSTSHINKLLRFQQKIGYYLLLLLPCAWFNKCKYLIHYSYKNSDILPVNEINASQPQLKSRNSDVLPVKDKHHYNNQTSD